MKKKLQKLLVTKTNLFERMIAGIVLCLFFQVNDLQAQSCPLACDDEVNVSLNEKCEALITPEIILEEVGNDCAYTVVVFGTNGLPLPDPVVNGTHLGKRLKVAIYLGQNSCWGHIVVEDKYRPHYDCPEPDTIYCSDRYFIPTVGDHYDNCTPANQLIKRILYDSMVMYEKCALRTDSIIGYRTIGCYYEDLSGNYSDTCKQYIYIRKFYEKDITWPVDVEYTCKEYNDSIPQPAQSGVPTVFGNPIYPDEAACKVAITFEDEKIVLCPKNFKVIRRWTVIDWCMPSGQNVYKYYQVIKVTDNKAPIVRCRPQIDISTDPGNCTGTAIVGPPTIIEECSNVTLQVGYKVLSLTGSPTYEGTSTANVFKLPNGFYRITGLPLGLNWVIFRVTDECGHYTDCSTEVLVEDKIPPIPVCDQKTIVSLTVDGSARVDAITFDDHSVDNCEIDYFEVRRMDSGFPCNTLNGNVFAPSVYFCCNDIGKTIVVELRVWDKGGNSNTCMVEVMVQDKISPIIFCPPNITVSCEFPYTNYDVFGTVVNNIANRKPIVIKDIWKTINGEPIDGYAYDGCGATIQEFPNANLRCGQGTISRTFVATDPSGNSNSCTQFVTVQDFTPNSLQIQFPIDYSSPTTCMSLLDLDPKATGTVTIFGADKCNNVFSNYEDKVYTKDPDACLKVIRTWTVIDWCIYDPNSSNTRGYYTWKQIIKINNTQAPQFETPCFDRTAEVFGPGCGGNVDIVADAKDDCTDSADLRWTFTIDLYNDKVADPSYNRNSFDGSNYYPTGTHLVTFTVTDACENVNRCSYLLTVRDAKKPTPYCIGTIVTTVMPSTKNIEIWAKDFNLNSEDNCTEKENLKYYFLVNNVWVTSMTFDCANIGKNIIRIYVVDEAGNSDYCEATMEVQDPNKVCKTTGLTIQGQISTAKNQLMDNVGVFLERTNPAGSALAYTDNQGVFSFKSITANTSYSISAEKNHSFLNGVSTADIVLIQKHILGKALLTTPYKIIAADANNNGAITSADISEVRKLILGSISAFTKNKSWRFIPAAYVFQDPNSPFPFAEKIEYNSISRNEMNTNFVGVKIGDVTEDSNPNLTGGSISSRTNDKVNLIVDEKKMIKSEPASVSFIIEEDYNASGLQFEILFNSAKVKFVSLQSDAFKVNADMYIVNNNSVRISVAPEHVMTLKAGTELFNINLLPLETGLISSAIEINKAGIASEIYDEEVNSNPLYLNFRKSSTSAQKELAKIIQNSPNPFTEQTTVDFYLPKNQYASFEIFDINGGLISKTGNNYTEGRHSLVVKRTQLRNPGIYYIRMNSEDYSETIKMVLIK
ncbi:MAG: T9SS type A sorting domain-containing protein [Saprospiraceae bacterium]|nr:T9SS type A sorting domain-containing protein [Saprospiraceae bacterium]